MSGVEERRRDELQCMRGPQFVRQIETPAPLFEALPCTGRGRLIAITGPTGHGKTTVAACMQVSQALALPFAGRDVTPGKVLVLCGENPDDYGLHLIATMIEHALEPADLDDILIVPSRFNIDYEFERLKAMLVEFGPVAAVYVDTSAAFYMGSDDNGNVEQHLHASSLRSLSELPGKPVVFVLCHPVKNATKDNLVPRGGGAFLNEIDANLTVWKDTDGVISMHWAGKMRGQNFEPLKFEMRQHELPDHADTKGRPTVSVAAHHLADEAVEQLHQREVRDEDHLIVVMLRNPEASVRSLAMKCGWTSPTGKPLTARIDRRLNRLRELGLADQNRKGSWRLTSKGQKEAEAVR